MAAYPTSLHHILAELERLDLLIRTQVARARQLHNDEAEGISSPALFISEEEVDALLTRPIGGPVWATSPLANDIQESVQTKLDHMATQLTERIEDSLRQGIFLRLVALARLFDLSVFDLDVVLVCLAPELDRRYERLFAYLHDDLTRRPPTVDLVLNLTVPRCANQSSGTGAPRFDSAAHPTRLAAIGRGHTLTFHQLARPDCATATTRGPLPARRRRIG